MEEEDSPNSNPKNPNSSSSSLSPLPPGCHFFPSEHQLVSHYLTLKNTGDPSSSLNLINELNIYRYEPFNLPESACFVFGREGRKKHWYCYGTMPRVKRGRGEVRRVGGAGAGAGYWRRSGSVKDIVCEGMEGVVVGSRKMFVFYLGDVGAKSGLRTKWFMYEYSLSDHKMAEASYVLCRVFTKSHHRCNSSNNLLRSCHENVKTARHIGLQCDDTSVPPISESRIAKGSSIDSAENNDLKRICAPSDNITDIPVALQVNTMDFEGDFIELNDLLSPL